MSLKKAILKSFNSGNYTAGIQVSGSNKIYLESITLARNIPSADMITDRKVAVFFHDEDNAKEAVVIAVYT